MRTSSESKLRATAPVRLRHGLWTESPAGLRRVGARVPRDFFRGRTRALRFFVVRPSSYRRWTLRNQFRADAVILVDEGQNRLFVDAALNFTYRETAGSNRSCYHLRQIWEMHVKSSRLLSLTATGCVETLIRGTPVARLNSQQFSHALRSAVRQLSNLRGCAELGASREHVERGFEVLDRAGQSQQFDLLIPLKAALSSSPLVPAGSDNSPHNALFSGGRPCSSMSVL